MDEMMRKLVENMDEETARELIGQVDEDEVALTIEWVFQELVIPHLEEVRERAKADPPNEEVRRMYESEAEDYREEMFWETFEELVKTLVLCRERPKEGLKQLKQTLRDPFTAEALLLIFENREHIDPAYTEELKDFGTINMRYLGVMVLPEMYSEAERRQVRQELGIEVQEAVDGHRPPG